MEELSLFGETIDIPDDVASSKKIIKKIKEPKRIDTNINKAIISKKISLDEKVEIIKSNVDKILGQHKNDTLVIKTKEDFISYIDRAIANGVIALDTETNNSLDPITCKLMGACIYTPGMKQAYVPVNHIDMHTKEKLSWQLTEEDCREQFQRLVDNKTMCIFHNGKFDYEVIKCTCNIALPIDWDTLIGARLLNENESASLKEQYILHINHDQEKYSIEKLFEKEEYAIFEPEVFALYAATDAQMTYQLYLYQKNLFEQESNSKIYNLFKNVEMPCVEVVAEMELYGIKVDKEYADRLNAKYHKMLNTMQTQIDDALNHYSIKIEEWRKTPEATTKTKKSDGKFNKSKSEQLSTPINLNSPTQLAIFLYDVLKAPCVSSKSPRGTGKDELNEIYSKTHWEFLKLLLDYKKLLKLVDAFLDSLPKTINQKTGRIHCSYNQIGADTGRFSCSEPNLQQIPSKNKEIRMIFEAKEDVREVEVNCTDDVFNLKEYEEVETMNGWKFPKDIVSDDIIVGDDSNFKVIASLHIDNYYSLRVARYQERPN